MARKHLAAAEHAEHAEHAENLARGWVRRVDWRGKRPNGKGKQVAMPRPDVLEQPPRTGAQVRDPNFMRIIEMRDAKSISGPGFLRNISNKVRVACTELKVTCRHGPTSV